MKIIMTYLWIYFHWRYFLDLKVLRLTDVVLFILYLFWVRFKNFGRNFKIWRQKVLRWLVVWLFENRNFYSYTVCWRKWNIPVHNWLKLYLKINVEIFINRFFWLDLSQIWRAFLRLLLVRFFMKYIFAIKVCSDFDFAYFRAMAVYRICSTDSIMFIL